VLSGGGYGLTPYADPRHQDVSHSLTAVDIEWFMPLETFKRRMGEFSRMVKSRRTRPGFAEVLIPGEQEARRVERKAANGVPLDSEVLKDLQALRGELGILPEIEVIGPYSEERL
jgi:LDH2 family malate/lactate/ureidoglycolate dehydrogenase